MAYLDRRVIALETIAVKGSAPGLYAAFFKRAFDLACVALLALPVAVVVGFLALFVALDGYSAFYLQKRIGRNGKVFYMVKLRSMVKNADLILEGHLARNPEARAEWDEKQKLKNDPRITKVGKFIRKTSLDELPQLWNVLMGDMSLVGPRPMMEDQKSIYPGADYYKLRPGITGLWQVSERNEASFAQRAFYDNMYYDDLGFVSDLKIMLRTVAVVLTAKGH
ncbi:sugar transferase [Cognatishimia sp. SS12]|uniref:sugar transferase n=1 Tax=Cognatishimia sp. SS12 TaxID=2979465 RepID=UPI00232AE591|nr:sugar transferase [Cognatishimia sp. SS12]MDC0736823.1 sugar transferase [Cognatishimia sp. SS12]